MQSTASLDASYDYRYDLMSSELVRAVSSQKEKDFLSHSLSLFFVFSLSFSLSLFLTERMREWVRCLHVSK